MFDAINPWNMGMEQFGQTSGQDGAQPIYNPVGRDGISSDLMSSVGYTPPPMAWGGVDSGVQQQDPVQAFTDYLTSKGLHLGQQYTGNNQAIQQVFDANNQPVGQQYAANLEQDPGGAFAAGVLGMGAFGGAAAAGLLGGGAAAGDAASGFGGIDMSGGAAGAPVGSGGLAGTGLPEYSAYSGVGSAPGYAAGPGGLSGEAVGGDGAFVGESPWSPTAAAGGDGSFVGEAPWSPTAGGGSSFGDMASQAGNWMKQNPGLTNVGGSLVNGLIGAYSANQALNAQKNAANQANAMWAPYNQFGVQNLGRANGLLQNPSSITSDPGYQFTTQQGVQALDRSAASKGGLYSGAQGKALERFGQGNANTYFDKILGRYTGAAQLGATGTTNISNNLIGIGNAGAGASMYTGNVAQNGVNSALGNFNYTNALQSGLQPFNQSTYPRGSGP